MIVIGPRVIGANAANAANATDAAMVPPYHQSHYRRRIITTVRKTVTTRPIVSFPINILLHCNRRKSKALIGRGRPHNGNRDAADRTMTIERTTPALFFHRPKVVANRADNEVSKLKLTLIKAEAMPRYQSTI